MKIHRTLLSLSVAFVATAAHAQPFSIDRFTIAGSGGTSSGGLYALSGTLGQPATGAMSGGHFSLAGGFWGAPTTPPPAGSVLTIRVLIDGEVRLRFTGIPGRIYYVERAHSITLPAPWPEVLAAITMPIEGVVEFTDIDAASFRQSFYRTSTD